MIAARSFEHADVGVFGLARSGMASVRALRGQVNLSFGWGTNLTNDFVGCAPAGVDGQLKAISLVCKVVEADGRPAVKLSDNPNKVLGPPDEVQRYQRIFGLAGMKAEPVVV